jgi:hypothetical protein
MPREFRYDVECVREVQASEPPALVHPGWAERFPWLVQGTTRRGAGDAAFDLGLFSGGSREEDVRSNWSELRRSTDARRVIHAPQLHGCGVRRHGPPGGREGPSVPSATGPEPVRVLHDPTLVAPCDGHVTDEPGILLAVTTADCVPVFAVDAVRRVVGVFHAGWRGAAQGVLQRGLDLMRDGFGSTPGDVYLHMGPAICGACYEVGPEVFAALDQATPPGPAPIDLRRVLAERAVTAGVAGERITVSWHCTRCTASGLFSHRAGDAHRQVGYLGVRA